MKWKYTGKQLDEYPIFKDDDGPIHCVAVAFTQEDAEFIAEAHTLLDWQPISTAPRDGTFVELRGDSGMRGYPYRVMIARYEPNRADPERIINTDHGDEWAWRTVAGDHVTDDGAFPTHWRPVS